MSFGEIVRQRRKELNMTQDDVSVRVGISKPYLSNIETERVKNPPSDQVIRRLEQALKFQEGELRKLALDARTPLDIRSEMEASRAEVGRLRGIIKHFAEGKKGRLSAGVKKIKNRLEGVGVGETFSAGKPVPVINKVQAGYPHHFTDLDYPPSVADEYVRVPDVHDPQAFAARVIGDSMEPRYHEGDLVVFAPNLPVRNGDECFVRFTADNSTTFKRYLQRGDRIRLEPLNTKYQTEEYDREEINGLWPAVMRIERIR